MKRFTGIFAAAMVCAMALAGSALAWPADPPARATIIGPGIDGEQAITEASILAGLSLGRVENFDSAIERPATIPPGYTINRWFEGGAFHFGTITYYPSPNGQPGYVHFEDGPDITGSHKPYHDGWYIVRPEGQATLTRLVAQMRTDDNFSFGRWMLVWLSLAIAAIGVFAAIWIIKRRAYQRPPGQRIMIGK